MVEHFPEKTAESADTAVNASGLVNMNGAALRVVFIAGAGRSGSTILARLLGQCEGCTTAGEIRHLGRTGAVTSDSNTRCGCGRTFAECEFWRRVMAGLGERGWDPLRMEGIRKELDRTRNIPRILRGGVSSQFGRALTEFGAYQADLYALVAAQSDAMTVIDSSKDPSSLFLACAVPGVEVDVVHLVRDPRAVAFSWTTKKRRPEVVEGQAYMRTYGVARSAIFWVVSNALAELGGRRASSYQRLRYEDFVQKPGPTVGRVLQRDAAELGFIDGKVVSFPRREHLVRGNPDRFRGGRVEIARDDRWVTQLTATRRLLVSAICVLGMARYGYFGASQPPQADE